MAFATHPNQKRSACERCRRQKLRCSRQDDENGTRCTRCVERGMDCVAGHQRRIGRPSRRMTLDHAMPKRLPEVSVPSTNTDGDQRPAYSVTHDSLPGNSPLDPSTSTTALGHGTTTETTISLDYHLDDFPWNMSLDPQLDSSISVQMAEEEMGRITSTPQIADPATQNEAFVKISKINVDLHSYLSSIEINRPHLDFCSFTHPSSILSVSGRTMPELVLVAFQDFVGILTGLNEMASIHRSASPTTNTSAARPALAEGELYSESGSLNPLLLVRGRASSPLALQAAVPSTNVLDQPLVLIITSCYVQIIAIFEEIFVQIHKRLEAIAWDPIQPIEGIKFGAFPIEDAHLQGVIFSQIVESLLEKANRFLGVHQPMESPSGTVMSSRLLSPIQSDLLHGQLESKDQASVPRSVGLKIAIQRLRSTLEAAA
ncbi:uncharacterized protein CLUP02_02283 [Colletotrichum lupini]|uniref:Zn(2)-C6 fungal-type domain-containing protein n=1 Tax=Colletotrichum lupini TaxID=145971 RepID=A0A9Q8SDZ0_9PEZI|nr:uncharacterized protein CLUP02_02283 [Colletotrichum lupini]UQC75627.1 hypothetical protein CLUP02_02283 [Colletotrichum lupini]